VPAVERGGAGVEVEPRRRQLDRAMDAAARISSPGEEPVVGTDQNVVTGAQRHRPPAGADTGIDDADDHRRRQVPHGLRQDRRAVPNVLWRDVMGDVDHPDRRRDASDDTVTGRDEPVPPTVVGEQRDPRDRRQLSNTAVTTSSMLTKPTTVPSRSSTTPS